MRCVSEKKKVVEKLKTHILCPVDFFLNMCHLWGSVATYSRARQDTDDSKYSAEKMWFACEV